MNAQSLPRRRAAVPVKPYLIGGLAALLFLLSLASFFLDSMPVRPVPLAPAVEERIVYVVFGRALDSVYAAPASDPSRRSLLFQVPHADQFGIVASLAPDGSAVAYNALPASELGPAPDAPAELWLRPLDGQPRLLSNHVDLRVRPVWAASASAVVARRSDQDGVALLMFDVNGSERRLTTSADALFPVAFGDKDSLLYFVRISEAGSELLVLDLASGYERQLAVLSEGLTRDWTLSQSGDRLAFLALTFTAEAIASRALVLDLATGVVSPVSDGFADEFSPTWRGDSLAIGRLGADTGVAVAGDLDFVLNRPARGFDVPLAWSASGDALVVRSFEGSSAMAPGRSVLNLLTKDGSRVQVAAGEVTFLGWISR
jgi:hypothetical protein